MWLVGGWDLRCKIECTPPSQFDPTRPDLVAARVEAEVVVAPLVQVVGVNAAAAHRQRDGKGPHTRKHVPWVL